MSSIQNDFEKYQKEQLKNNIAQINSDVHLGKTIATRHQEYGDYEKQAEISQRIKGILNRSPGFSNLPCYQQESLEMIITKIARIVNRGDGTKNKDSWHDIAGNATLVETKL